MFRKRLAFSSTNWEKKMKFVLVFLLGALSGASLAAESFLPNNFKSAFVQVFKSKISGKERKSPGHLDYSYPGKIRFAVDDPSGKSLFVSNQRKSWYYTPPFIEGEKGEVTIRKSKNLALTKFFDSIKRGLKTNKLYKVESKGKAVLITFSKRSAKDLNMTRARLSFSQKNYVFEELKSIEIFRKSGKKVKVILNNIKSNISFKQNHFDFVVPKNTTVIDES